jgi:hypothetical protein
MILFPIQKRSKSLVDSSAYTRDVRHGRLSYKSGLCVPHINHMR